MKVFVSGATGFIGKHLSQKLAEQGNIVHALYRSGKKTVDMQHPNIIFFKGDITDIDSLYIAMKNCEYVFHLAAYAKVWSKQRNTFEIVNYQGTVNVLETAIQHRIKKVIVTSTAGVFGPSSNAIPVNEFSKRTVPYFSEYERTKDLADKMIMEKYSSKIDVTIVCPTRVFGPGELSASNSVTRLISLYISGKYRFLPGKGQSIGNYVYIDDVVTGMLLALEKGCAGERYILGGENVSFSDFFARLSNITGKSYTLFKIPVAIIMLLATTMKFFAILFQIPPLLTPGWARKYLYDWKLSSNKAGEELNYKPQLLEEGFIKTVMWIKSNKKANSKSQSMSAF